MPTGWLADQLPRVLARDRFTRRFVGIFEEVADDVRNQIDALEYYVDLDTAPPEFVRWIGGWLQVTVDPELSVERQREIVRAAGRLYAQRGTLAGLRGLLEAVTGADVRVVDGGGTWRQGEAPPNPGRVLVRLTETGNVPEDHLYRMVAAELPIGVSFDLRLGDRSIGAPVAPRGVHEILGSLADDAVVGGARSPDASDPGDAS